MKSLLLTLFVMLCSIQAYASESGNYKGTLTVTVNADPEQKSEQIVQVMDNGAEATLRISNFTFPGFPLPLTIVITATKNATGTLGLKSISVSGINIQDALFDGTLFGGHCEIGLALNALNKDVFVEFSGNK